MKANEYEVRSESELPNLVARLQPGDTMVLSAGVARSGLVLSGVQGRCDAPIRIVAREETALEPSRTDGILLDKCEYIVIDGIRIRNARRAGILVSGSRNIEIRNCILEKNHKSIRNVF